MRDADQRKHWTPGCDVAQLDEPLGEIESDDWELAGLLSKYLQPNARPLGLHIHPYFGGVLDGLATVVLLAVDRPTLDSNSTKRAPRRSARYIGSPTRGINQKRSD